MLIAFDILVPVSAPIGLFFDYMKKRRKIKNIRDGKTILPRNQWAQIQVPVYQKQLTHIYKQ